MIRKRISDLIYDLNFKKNKLFEFFYFRWLKRKLKTSESLGLDYCSTCGYCCRYVVCVATPDELEVIAEYLNLDPVDFILEKCAFAHYHKETDKETICILYPRFLTKSILHKAGTQLYSLDFFDTKGCAFLTESNKCSIHPVRPQEAKLMECWQEQKHNEPILTWNNDVITSKFGIVIQRDTDDEFAKSGSNESENHLENKFGEEPKIKETDPESLGIWK